MAVDNRNSIRIRDRHLVRGDSDELAVLLMQFVDGQISPAVSTFPEIPEVGELCEKRSGDIPNLPVTDIWQDVVEGGQSEQDPGGEQE